ncbi:hypothetical protein AMTR_s00060p00211550 [Amborella trichopoda]|uniref:Uncharacterized protein n=1 Tax=Amborella trichopoda TaxID=13333 RepID=W1NKA9_AMBTC|nr:hypothetical protein AMTR_s00060p00211550 [Amborella trichopoda]
MDYGKELLNVVHRLPGRSSLEELIQLSDFLERTTTNLTAFGVPWASQLKRIIGELAQEAGEISKQEGLISPTLNLSIGPLLDFFPDQPSIFGYTKGLLGKLKSDLLYREGFDPTLQTYTLEEGEDIPLGGISLHELRLAWSSLDVTLLRQKLYHLGVKEAIAEIGGTSKAEPPVQMARFLLETLDKGRKPRSAPILNLVSKEARVKPLGLITEIPSTPLAASAFEVDVP